MSNQRKSEQAGTFRQETYRILGSLTCSLLTLLIPIGITALARYYGEGTLYKEEKKPIPAALAITNITTTLLMYSTFTQFNLCFFYIMGSTLSSIITRKKPWEFENLARKISLISVFFLGLIAISSGTMTYASAPYTGLNKTFSFLLGTVELFAATGLLILSAHQFARILTSSDTLNPFRLCCGKNSPERRNLLESNPEHRIQVYI